jgi:formylglycine-generating enzyme required for sulfatase activity
MLRVHLVDGATYVWIPEGDFWMGSAESDIEKPGAEKPMHLLPMQGFWMMKTEVTNANYALCVSAGVCTPPSNATWEQSAYASYPVVNVDWRQASLYADWVGGHLPTEAEWEKACRGSDGRFYPWGNDPPLSAKLLNFTATSASSVGSYPDGKSPYGVLDLVGNAWEWTGSLWGESPSRPDFGYPYDPGDGREDLTAPYELLRVLRGGSFVDTNPLRVTCTVRSGASLISSKDYVGFRVAMGP